MRMNPFAFIGVAILLISAVTVIVGVTMHESVFFLSWVALGGLCIGWLVGVAWDATQHRYDSSKIILDEGIAFLGLLLAAPVMLLIAVSIPVTSPGPILYRQVRAGQNRRRRSRRNQRVPGDDGRRGVDQGGELMVMYKFRTMSVQAEADGVPVWAKKKDPRVTTIGRFLRGTHLDELPQLINVLVGDMSLVGPRPERPYFVERLRKTLPNYSDRLSVKPGVTGLAQVCHAADSSVEDVRTKLGYDRYYIKRASFWLDLKIVILTVRRVLIGKYSSFELPKASESEPAVSVENVTTDTDPEESVKVSEKWAAKSPKT